MTSPLSAGLHLAGGVVELVRDVRPGRAGVRRHLHVAIVGARPVEARLLGGLGERVDRGPLQVRLPRERDLLLAGLGQIRADALEATRSRRGSATATRTATRCRRCPGCAATARSARSTGSGAPARRRATCSGVRRTASCDVSPVFEVLPARRTELALVVDAVGVPPVADDVEAVARRQVLPVVGEHAVAVAVLRRPDPRAVVLRAAHDVVRHARCPPTRRRTAGPGCRSSGSTSCRRSRSRTCRRRCRSGCDSS